MPSFQQSRRVNLRLYGVCSRRMNGCSGSRSLMFFSVDFERAIQIGVLLRLILVWFGLVQDAVSHVKFTDIDYEVFSDAASFVLRSLSLSLFLYVYYSTLFYCILSTLLYSTLSLHYTTLLSLYTTLHYSFSLYSTLLSSLFTLSFSLLCPRNTDFIM
jgi:hypothetical protein